MTRQRPPQTRRLIAFSTLSLGLIGLTACSVDTASGSETSTSDTTTAASATSSVWDENDVHDIAIDVDEGELAAIITAYAETGEKEWASADVTIDGTTIANVGLKLKGNSSLRGTTTESDPATLPWIIRTDKFIDDQTYDGETEIVVRSNSSETSLNEAVALDLLGQTGLATEEASSTRFSVNGSDETLRLLVQNPSDTWDAEQFGTDGLLYKAESTGDYTYRGDDASSYDDVFDQEAGEEDDLEPLTDFLQFINDSDDETFAAQLGDRLDIDSFATYLAFQDLVGNGDDISGKGNNSYLRYTVDTGQMTVVNWDLNLAFGVGGPGMAGGAGPGEDGAGERPERPEGAPTGLPDGEFPEGGIPEGGIPEGQVPDGPPPENGELPDGAAEDGEFGGAPGGAADSPEVSNVLVDRFLAVNEFAALYEDAQEELSESLVESGTATDTVNSWAAVLEEQATDLVDAETIQSDADQITEALA